MADITAENDLQKVLNLTLQARWDVGISNVDSDLPLIPLPDNLPSFSMSEQIIAVFMLLSPTSKTSVSTALNKTQPPPNPNPASKFLLFNAADELPCSSTPSLYHLDTHRLIIDLAEAKHYLPLTLFTAKAMQHLYQESGSLKLIKSQHPIMKTMVNVIDTSSFGDEKDMDTIDWLEAISCYLVFLKQHASPKITSCFDNHFQFLLRQDNFKHNFPAILAADIEYCQNYSAQPRAHDQKAFEQCFTKIKLEKKIAELLNKHEFFCSQLADCSHHDRLTHCSKPYPCNVSGPWSKPASSFHSSARPSGDGPTPHHLCLICARISHKFSNC
ncbi:hypothetical protein PAXRUDRAFT_766154 [Paxillus rubicundulus Ve08.2h10]|uniref:Uncharacterized protein n=1 Tax=Paxillus rubicundulus Ve08.2h10 TaxID=930991 RepID=A0A0D0DGG6_9AGAM|nr:hypothetical protein PAXRUDRAFT_766154 [Paxillus rubicundulus Ve08.2h10]